MRIAGIVRGTTVDGPGFRTSVYLSGCTHACPGCHNPSTWDVSGGEEMTLEQIMEVIREEDFDVTLSGGDPLCHPEEAMQLAKACKEAGYGVWLYSGYTWEQITRNERLSKPLEWVDTLVDGPFISDLRDETLLFRGSSNQRLINVAESLEHGAVVEWKKDF